MNSTIISCFLIALSAAAGNQPQYLLPLPKQHLAPVESVSRQTFLSSTNVQRIVVLPSLRWQLSGLVPGPLIARFKQAFESTGTVVGLTKEQEDVLAGIPLLHSPSPDGDGSASRGSIRWSDVYFLTHDGGFLSFGEIEEGFLFFTDKTAGVVLIKGAEPVAPHEPPPRASASDAPDDRTLDSLPAPGSSGGR